MVACCPVFATMRSIGSLIAGIVLIVIGNGLLGTSMTLRMGIEAFSPTVVGLVLAAYYVGLTTGAILLPRTIARVGHIRVFAAVAATSALSMLAMPVLLHPVAWILLRGAAGMAMAGVFIVLESWLNSTSDATARSNVLAVYMIAVQLALAGGQLLVMVYDPGQDVVFLAACGLHIAALIPVSLTYVEQPPPPTRQRYGLRALLGRAPVGVYGCFVAGMITSALLAVGPMFTSTTAHSHTQTALFMLVVALSGLALQWPLGGLSNRIGRRPVLVGVCSVLAMVCIVLTWLEPHSFALLLALTGGAGALAFVVYPLALAYCNDLIDSDKVVAASSTLLLAFGTGSAVGPLVTTRTMAWVGPYGMFWAIAAVALLFAGITARRVIIRKAIPKRMWSAFKAVPWPQAATRGQLYVEDEEPDPQRVD